MTTLLIIILIFAIAPIVLPLVFSEIMAAKEGDKTNDFTRKLSRNLGWLFFSAVCMLMIYIALDYESSRQNLNTVFKGIVSMFRFLMGS